MQFLNIWLIDDYEIIFVLFYMQLQYLSMHIYSSTQSL